MPPFPAHVLRDIAICLGGAGIGSLLCSLQQRAARATPAPADADPLAGGQLARTGSGSQLSTMCRKVHGECIYLDWNATSPIFPEVSEAMLPYIGDCFGNPSSAHAFGRPCAAAVRRGLPRAAGAMHQSPRLPSFVSRGINGLGYVGAAPAQVRVARQQVGRLVGATPEEILFTSCGSESDNQAILIAVARGLARLPAGAVPHVVTTNVEHPAILECLGWGRSGC
jgi:cysteine desulfurase